MKDSQIYQILATIPDLERRRLKKWVRSPFVNNREDVVILFDYLNRPDSPADRRAAYARMWPREAYDDARLRQTMHR